MREWYEKSRNTYLNEHFITQKKVLWWLGSVTGGFLGWKMVSIIGSIMVACEKLLALLIGLILIAAVLAAIYAVVARWAG